MDILDQIDSNLATKKVGVVEFAESESYCGKRLYPRQRLLLKLMFLEELTGLEEDALDYWIDGGRNGSEVILSPLIRERISYLRELGYPHFREVVLVGGRRSSKGFITGIAMAKLMYDCLQLQDPGLHYQIDPDKEIYFSCVAASQDQAKKYQYADFASTVQRCLAMGDNLTKTQELEFSVATEADKRKMSQQRREGRKVSRDMSKLRGAAFAANASTIRGSATMALVMDEMAHMMQEGDSAATAEMVYDAALPSLAQFDRDAMVFCNSSPYTKLGKFYERFAESLKAEEGEPSAPLMFGIQFPSWAMFEGYQDDPQRRFRKAITVSPDWDETEEKDGHPYFSEEDIGNIKIAREEERQEPEKYKVERRGQFAEVVDAYLRPEAVDYAQEGKPDGKGGFLILKTNWDNPTYMHRYKAHLDPSSTTAGFGFALGHTEQIQEEGGGLRTHAIIDIVKRWNPRDMPNRVIDWEIVLQEVLHYAVLFEPYEITFDQFQNQAPMQWLRRELTHKKRQHIRVYEKTATAQYNWQRAEVFRTALYQGIVHFPADISDAEYAALELKYLQQVNTAGRFPRVDKQDIGPVQTKDMADAMMEVVDGLVGNLIANEVRENLGSAPNFGASGGFSIGGSSLPRGNLPDEYGGYYSTRKGEQRVPGARARLEGLNSPARRGSWGSRRRGR